ncbi:hypothetical protein H4582DRAFT_173139 [Lactarius indigo]|nr:hypothetical protein H4582DRAFT_173139 [Lactarius indigo]
MEDLLPHNNKVTSPEWITAWEESSTSQDKFCPHAEGFSSSSSTSIPPPSLREDRTLALQAPRVTGLGRAVIVLSRAYTSFPCVGARRTPTPHVLPSPSLDPVSAQTQIASLRRALEAARLREEKSLMEAKCRTKEYDALCLRWMQEIAHWQHSEAQV